MDPNEEDLESSNNPRNYDKTLGRSKPSYKLACSIRRKFKILCKEKYEHRYTGAFRQEIHYTLVTFALLAFISSITWNLLEYKF
jgi:hypothetical protein